MHDCEIRFERTARRSLKETESDPKDIEERYPPNGSERLLGFPGDEAERSARPALIGRPDETTQGLLEPP